MFGDSIVGGDILRLITAGMYANPLVLFREYLQNAADAIASQGRANGSVLITIDPLEAQVTITDDGTGLSPADASNRLVRIGNSTKNPAVDRGLRGIGRLSSLAFAESVHFTTRTSAAEPVTRVSWSGLPLRDPDFERADIARIIDACATVRSLPDDDWPDRFFQVSVERVSRHAASMVLNRDAVRAYIGEVCPVPMAPSFPLEAAIRQFLSTHTDYFVLDVHIQGDEEPIQRPFGEAIALTDTYAAPFERLETRVVPQLDGDDPAAILWLAHTPYAGSIPRRHGVCGLRARAGNIQIGSDDIFSHLFHETRFNGWCVGEVHIADSRIVPNGRRDYFEPGPHLRNLENHIGAIAHEISSRCRTASSHRNRLRNLGAALHQTKRAIELARSGYLLPQDAAALLARTREKVPQIRRTLDELEIAPSHFGHDDLSFSHGQTESEASPAQLALDGVSSDTVFTLQSAFAALANAMPPDSAMDMIEAILRRLSGQQPSSDPAQR